MKVCVLAYILCSNLKSQTTNLKYLCILALKYFMNWMMFELNQFK